MSGALSVNIRLGGEHDFPALVVIDQLAAPQSPRAEFLMSCLRDGECLIAESQGTPAGFVILNYSFFKQGFIALVVVAENMRRGGIGLQLLQAAKQRCATEKLFTSTNQSNAAAQALFAAAGFLRSGVVENLDEGDHEFIFFCPCRGETDGGPRSLASALASHA